MHKLFTILCCLALALSGRSQTLHLLLPSGGATCNSTLDVPVRVKNFTNLLSLQGTISWDTSRLQFQAIADFGPASLALGAGNFGTNNASAGRMTFSWNDAALSGKTLPDSTAIFTIRFLVLDATSGNAAIAFTNSPTAIEAINTSFNLVPYQLVNGTIAVSCFSAVDLKLILPRVNVGCNDSFDIPVRAVDFRNLLSLQGSLSWDPASAQFQRIASYGAPSLALSSGNFGLNNTANGKLSFSWNDADLSGESLPDSTVLFSMRFKGLAPSAASGAVQFVNTPTILEAINKDFNAVAITTTSGQINVSCAAPGSLNLILPEINSGCSNVLDVPVNVTNFNALLSLQASIGWDPSILQFQAIAGFGPAALRLNANNFGLNNSASGRLSFSWNDADLGGETLADSTSLFIIRFRVVGAIGRGSLLEFTNSPTIIEAIGLGYNPVACRLVNGYANIGCSQVSGNLSLIFPALNASCSSYVDIPVKANGFYSMLSFQGTMGWDSSRLQFTDIVDFGPSNLSLGYSNFDTTLVRRGRMPFAWSDAGSGGETLLDSSVLFTVRFRVIAPVSGIDSIRFTSDPQMIQAVNSQQNSISCTWVNGAVSVNCPVFTPLRLSMPLDSVVQNDTVDIPVRVAGFNNLLSFQGSVYWESAKLQFLSVAGYGPSTLAMGASNFGTAGATGGRLTFSWNDADLTGESLADSTRLFIIRFKAVGTPGANSVLQFTNNPTLLEAIDTRLSQVILQQSNGSVLIKAVACVPTSSTTGVVRCSNQLPYRWNGTDYNSAGTYKDTLTNAAGCDSVATLNLTVNQTSSSTETVTACGSYIWNEMVYSTSGIKTWTGTNAAGCDSVATLNLTINNTSAPSGSTPQIFCNNATVANLTATGTAVQWYSTETGGTALASNVPLVNGSIYYAAQTVGGCESSGRLAVAVSITGTANVFIGSGNWTNPGNWSCGTVPAPGDVFSVAAGKNAVLNTNLNVSGSFTLNTGSTLIISPGRELAVAAGGTVNFNGASVTLKSDASGTAAIGKIIGTLSGATKVTIERYVPVYNTAFTPSHIKAWRMLSVPTFVPGGRSIRSAWQEGGINNNGFGVQISGTPSNATALGFDIQSTNFASMQSYNGTAWVNIPNTNNYYLDTSGAYFLFIRGNRTVGSTTPVTDNSKDAILRTTGSIYQGNGIAGVSLPTAFTVAGNIYPSAIDFVQLQSNNSSKINSVFNLWDARRTSGSSLGSYQTFSATNGYACTPGGGSFTLNQVNTTIQSGQGFFVVARNPGTGQKLVFNESIKVSGSSNNAFRPLVPADRLVKIDTRLLDAQCGEVIDGNTVVFNSCYANAVDGDDARKLQNPGENLGIQSGSDRLSVEGRKPASAGHAIQFSVSNLKVKAYVLDIAAQNLDTDNLIATLEDRYTQSSTLLDLNGTTRIPVAVDVNPASKAADRFRIVFGRPAVVGKAGFAIAPNPVLGNSNSINIRFMNQSAGRYTARLLGMDGKIIQSAVFEHAGGTALQSMPLDTKLVTGTYQLELTGADRVGRVVTVQVR